MECTKEYAVWKSLIFNSLRLHGLYSPWYSPGQNTGVGGLSLLQGIFPTQGSNAGLPHFRQILYQLSHQESSRILEWSANPFSSGSSWRRNQTGVSCTAGDALPTELSGKSKRIYSYSIKWRQCLQVKSKIDTLSVGKESTAVSMKNMEYGAKCAYFKLRKY